MLRSGQEQEQNKICTICAVTVTENVVLLKMYFSLSVFDVQTAALSYLSILPTIEVRNHHTPTSNPFNNTYYNNTNVRDVF